ncbi:MAG: AAA family ATPase [Chitinophagales bacterium]|nr:AAA family ATPase [Chitinophagales bacterium]MDW8427271.1 AAA family ATPase [Chitinophagales bacterium]
MEPTHATITYADDVAAVDGLAAAYEKMQQQIGRVIVGQKDVIELVLISILCDSHSLLVGVPGLAKTLLVKTVADVLDLSFKRIQFTPDLMPSDIIGSEVMDESRHFYFSKGPVFANIILADEINRTPPKTQAALLESMQEKAVTVAGQRHLLPEPFFVLATQNPIEQEGTYPLPEAQLDRFMFEIRLGYLPFDEELRMVRETTALHKPELEKVLGAADILFFQKLVRKIPVTDNVMNYAVNLARRTRPQQPEAPSFINDYIAWGAGPRASQFLVLGAKCHAALHGKYAPDIEDVQAIALPVLRHRIVRNYKAEAENVSVEELVKRLL